ncbi:MAG: peptide chain release factor 1 [Chloroherpetonaceae bacterium]|nr:peptide chain release factor 1 [Chloroherpetonaceae bacterium]MDW8438321.1 peptide chain release factor 1 [Chloroherpetonaceae bacterium]
MFDKLDSIAAKYAEIERQLSDPDIIANQEKFRALNKEYRQLGPIVKKYQEYKRAKDDLAHSRDILANERDAELKALAQAEFDELSKRVPKLEEELKVLLLPKDEADSRNVIVEIRAGTGGDEASLFALDLFRMYQRYAERKGWKCSVLDYADAGGIGGYKEIAFELSGEDVYGAMKYESGVHRVQRVPETETQGRIHTSAATVAVLPEAEEIDVEIRREDLHIDTYRSGGRGGQNVNKVETAVRITHIPTGVVVACQEERSQLQNRERAMKMLRAKLYDMKRERLEKERADMRRSMVSTGDRSAKIRTYNFPQSRVTDHRINFTTHNLAQVLDGDLDELIEALRLHDQTERLKAQAEQTI